MITFFFKGECQLSVGTRKNLANDFSQFWHADRKRLLIPVLVTTKATMMLPRSHEDWPEVVAVSTVLTVYSCVFNFILVENPSSHTSLQNFKMHYRTKSGECFRVLFNIAKNTDKKRRKILGQASWLASGVIFNDKPMLG